MRTTMRFLRRTGGDQGPPKLAPFTISFEMMVGRGVRELATPALVLLQYTELKAAGASHIVIRDVAGQVRSLEEIRALAA